MGRGRCECFSADFLERGAEISLCSWVKQKVEAIDALVLNAGFYREGSLASFSTDQYEADFRANVHVNLYIVQQLLDLLDKGTKKRIFLIGSTAAYEPYPLVPAYGIQKWALRGLAINLRNELRDRESGGIGVTFVAPGATWTGMWEGEDLPKDR